MGFNPLVLAATMDEMSSELTELWQTATPSIDHMLKSPKKALTGIEYTFPVMTKGPASADTFYNGSDFISASNSASMVKGRDTSTRIMVHFSVFNKDIDEASNNKEGYKELFRHMPEQAMIQIAQEMNKQLVSGVYGSGDASVAGNGFDIAGLLTLNGNASYAPRDRGVTRAGFFHAQAPSAQTAVVHELASSGAVSGATPGWHNQYLHIDNLDIEGTTPIVGLQQVLSRQGSTQARQDHTALTDPGSYLALMQVNESRVRFTNVDAGERSDKHSSIRSGVQLAGIPGIVWHSEADIDLSLNVFSATQRQGLAYLLDKSWCLRYRSPAALAGAERGSVKGIWEVRKPVRLNQQDGYRFEMVFHGQFCSENRRNQAVITGLLNK